MQGVATSQIIGVFSGGNRIFSGAGRAVISPLGASQLAQFDDQAQGIVNSSFTAKGLADVGVQENEICTRVGAQGGKAEKSKSKGKGQMAKGRSKKPHLQDFLRVWQPKGVVI